MADVRSSLIFILGLFVNVVMAANPCSSSTEICKVDGSGGVRVVIAAPHGGQIRSEKFPDRDHGCFNPATRKCSWGPSCGRKDPVKCKASLKSDMHTLEIAVQLHERLCQLMGG
ncbi:hypothetical protein CAPTEDRAFT_212217, partial [Capitella teleta]